MTSLLLDGEMLGFILPILFVGVFFVVTIASIISMAKKADEKKRAQQASDARKQQASASQVYSANKSNKSSYGNKSSQSKSRNAHSTHAHVNGASVAGSDGHVHVGDEEEVYDQIVGSLGEVNDEGCGDLNGIRLIAHDLAYEDDEAAKDYVEVAKAVVLGDVINNPRFKGMRKR